jgi:glycine oxidase
LLDSIESCDVAVVGGGVIGLTIAWRAVQRGLRVTVLERGEPGSGTSRFAAGMLAPVSEADPSEQPLLRLGLASAKRYRAFVNELTEASGADPGLLECGTLVAARDADEARALERELAMRHNLGLGVRRVLPSEARRLEPGLAPVLRLALEIPDDHVIDPRRLTASLARAAEREGVRIRADVEVGSLAVHDDQVTGIRLASGERIATEQVVVAAGVWSPRLAGIPDEARVPVHPVKGQILRLHDPAGPGLLTRVLRMQPGYIVPRGDGRYVLGATVEQRGFDTTVTAGAVFELFRDAIELLPGLDELVIDEVSAGLRPATPDHAPAIGPGVIEGLHWATGHYRNGILLAPITAELALAGLLHEPLPELASDCDPRRFSQVAVRP